MYKDKMVLNCYFYVSTFYDCFLATRETTTYTEYFFVIAEITTENLSIMLEKCSVVSLCLFQLHF